MATVIISGITYNIYGTLQEAVEYMAPQLHGTTWNAVVPVGGDLGDADEYDNAARSRSRALVTATRMLDRQQWQGEPTADDQDLAWPRADVIVTVNGEDVDVASDEVPDDLVTATYELAAALLEDSSIQLSSSGSGPEKRVKAGPVEVEWFGPRIAGRFPVIIQELVGKYLSTGLGANSVTVPVATGTDEESQFDDCDRYDLE